MINYQIFNILSLFFAVQIIKTFQESFQDTVFNLKWPKMLSWCFYIAYQCWAIYSDFSYPLLNLLFGILLMTLIYKTSYHIAFHYALFRSCLLFATWMMIEIFTGIALNQVNVVEPPLYYAVGSATSKIILFTLVQINKRLRVLRTSIEISLLNWLKLFLVPLATIYTIHNTYILAIHFNDNTLLYITTMLMLLVNYIAFDIYDKLGKQADAEKRNLIFEQHIALCDQQASARETAYQESRKLRHDLHNYLLDIKATLNSEDITNSISKIDQMLMKNQIYQGEVSRSGNLSVDALINHKYSISQAEKIMMDCQVQIPDLLPYDGSDLCVILGNLIDNAIEAVRLLPEESRHIHCSLVLSKGCLAINIRNPYKGTIKMNKNRTFSTSKSDRHNHGIGLTSVNHVVQKYNGELQIQHEKGIFVSSVLLYPPEELREGQNLLHDTPIS